MKTRARRAVKIPVLFSEKKKKLLGCCLPVVGWDGLVPSTRLAVCRLGKRRCCDSGWRSVIERLSKTASLWKGDHNCMIFNVAPGQLLRALWVHVYEYIYAFIVRPPPVVLQRPDWGALWVLPRSHTCMLLLSLQRLDFGCEIKLNLLYMRPLRIDELADGKVQKEKYKNQAIEACTRSHIVGM